MYDLSSGTRQTVIACHGPAGATGRTFNAVVMAILVSSGGANVARPGTVHIGISGWTYAPWRGVFFPKGLPQKRELEYATSQFSSLEINGTFYGMQRPDAFADWADRAPMASSLR